MKKGLILLYDLVADSSVLDMDDYFRFESLYDIQKQFGKTIQMIEIK